MSILYQALKRREQLHQKLEPETRSLFSSSYSNLSRRTTLGGAFGRFLLALLVIGAGLYAAVYYYRAGEVLNPESTKATLSVPVIATNNQQPSEAIASTDTSTATVAEITTAINADDTVAVYDFKPEELQSISAIAAMLPESVQEPLPTAEKQPVQVGSEPSTAALEQYAQSLQRQGATVAAVDVYNQALGSGEADFSSRVNKWGLIAVSEPARAIPALRALVSERPRDAAARAQLGIALLQAGDRMGAREHLERAAALAPDSTPASAQVWYNLAVLYDQNAERNAAIIAYEKALQGAAANPKHGLLDAAAMQRRLNFLRSMPKVTGTNEPATIAEDAPDVP